MLLPLPFSSKELPTGEKLFRRKYGYKLTLLENSVTTFDITVPYQSQKVNEAQIIGCNSGVTVNFKILDTPLGTYSGTPNLMLDQFGFNVNVAKNYYRDHSEYDADLYVNMQIKVTIKNNTDLTPTIGINFTLHEVV